MSPEEAIKLGSSRMQNSFLEKGLMGVAAMANPVLGLGAAGIVNASNIKDVKNSIASLNAAGNTAAAEALQKNFEGSLKDKGPGWGWISSIIEGKPFNTPATTTPATVAPGTVSSTPSGGVSSPRTGSAPGVSSARSANERSDNTDSFSANTTGTVSGTNRGTSETRTGVTSDGAYGTSTTTGSAAPSSSPRPERSPSSSTQSQYEKAASAMSQGARVGLQKGGLVQKPKPKKAAPKRKTKI